MAIRRASSRSENRRQVSTKAEIRYGLFKTLTCTLEELSPSGARLALDEQRKLPERFALTIIDGGRPRLYTCLKHRQADKQVSVEFLSCRSI